ncbi:MAG: hypothetical protein EKK33_18270 [Bradyrhizobiaceae bacterium]|nr:MAG: hypothetical protein EKK33_18270 [Bradyrhizobiaceae bacterium]
MSSITGPVCAPRPARSRPICWRRAQRKSSDGSARPRAAKASEIWQLRRHGRACPGHPRIATCHDRTWMPGTSPGMTSSGGATSSRRRQNIHLRIGDDQAVGQ